MGIKGNAYLDSCTNRLSVGVIESSLGFFFGTGCTINLAAIFSLEKQKTD